VVVADAAACAAAPPGVEGRRFALAMVELSIVDVAVLTLPHGDLAWTADVTALCWPGTALVECPDGDDISVAAQAFALAESLGAQAAALVAGDAPDLPGLLLGKVFRAVGSAAVAVCATGAGSLVAAAAPVPLAGWLAAAVSVEDDDGVARLRAAAPSDEVVALGPSWHRLRRPEDVRLLDPGLEGWAATRALLSSPVRERGPTGTSSGAQ
jgi:hypothetical protein